MTAAPNPSAIRIDGTPKVSEALTTIYNNPLTFIAGGWGGSKTTSLVYAAYKSAFRWSPGLPGIMSAPTFGQLYTGFVERWRRYIPEELYTLYQSGAVPRIECYTPQGISTIYLASGQHAQRIEGKEASWAGADEVQDMPDLFERLVGRVRDPGASHLRFFAAGLTVQGWMQEVLEDEKLGPVAWVRVKSTDNPTLPKAYFENLKRRLNKRQYKIFALGEFAPPEKAIYPAFYHDQHVEDFIPYDPSLPLLIGQDFNLNPMASTLVQMIPACALHDAPRCFHCVGEVIEEGTTVDQARKVAGLCLAEGFNYKDPRRVISIPDASGISGQHARGDSDVGVFMQEGFTVRGPAWNALQKRLGFEPAGPCVNPYVRDRDNAVNAALENGEGLKRLYFSKRGCPKTIQAMANLTEKGRAHSIHDHPTAALGYVIAYLDPIRPPAAPSYRVTVGDPARGRGHRIR